MNDDTGITGVETIGQALQRLRLGRGMKQEDLAADSTVGIDIIRALEQHKQFDAKVTVLHKLAAALDVDVWELSGRMPLPGSGTVGAVAAIRGEITSTIDLIPGAEPKLSTGRAGDIPELRELTDRAWNLYWAGRFDFLASELPGSLRRAKVEIRDAGDRSEVYVLAAEIHQVAASTLAHLGALDSAHIALREALALARRSNDPLNEASHKMTIAWVLGLQGRFGEAERLAVATADAIRPTNNEDLRAWTLWGSLLTTAGPALARAGDLSTALTVLGDAEGVAKQTGRRTDWHTAWSRDGVMMQRVDAYLVNEDHAGALRVARSMPAILDVPQMSALRHMTDVAQALTDEGEYDAAIDKLDEVRQVSPVYMKVQRSTRHLARELARLTTPAKLNAILADMAAPLAS